VFMKNLMFRSGRRGKNVKPSESYKEADSMTVNTTVLKLNEIRKICESNFSINYRRISDYIPAIYAKINRYFDIVDLKTPSQKLALGNLFNNLVKEILHSDYPKSIAMDYYINKLHRIYINYTEEFNVLGFSYKNYN